MGFNKIIQRGGEWLENQSVKFCDDPVQDPDPELLNPYQDHIDTESFVFARWQQHSWQRFVLSQC